LTDFAVARHKEIESPTFRLGEAPRHYIRLPSESPKVLINSGFSGILITAFSYAFPANFKVFQRFRLAGN